MQVNNTESYDRYDVLDKLAEPWPEGSVLSKKYEFVSSPSYLEYLCCCLTVTCFDAYSPDYHRAQRNASTTSANLTKILFHKLISSKNDTAAVDLCKNVTKNFNAFMSEWTWQYLIDIDAITNLSTNACNENNREFDEIRNTNTVDEKVELLFKKLPGLKQLSLVDKKNN